MTIEIKVPTLGESVTEATVATWFKKPGDLVAADEMVCELETDKVTVEVPAPAAGRLAEILAPEGATVAPGAVQEPQEAPKAAAEPAEKQAEGKRVDVLVPTLPKPPFPPGSRRRAIRWWAMKCSANWKPTRFPSRFPRPHPACWRKSSPRKEQP